MVHAVFLPFLLERSNFSVWKKGTCTTAHHRRHAKVFKNTRIDKGKKRAFRELCLIFREQKTILKALLKIWFCGNHDVHPKTIHQILWRVSALFPDDGCVCVPSAPVATPSGDSASAGSLWHRNTAGTDAGH